MPLTTASRAAAHHGTPSAARPAAEDVAAAVAAQHADAVDRDARFPREAIDALRDRGMLSALVPAHLGGGGATLAETAQTVRKLARHCSATALVYAMHNIEVWNLVREGTTEPLRQLVQTLCDEQLLFANANSEIGLGGEAGRSRCALEGPADAPTLRKEVLAISYGAHADVIVATARRAPDAPETDQIQAVCRDFSLEPLSEWDATGLRGTCSASFWLAARVDPELIYPVAFSVLANRGGAQATLILQSAVWVGIAEAAAAKAHAYVRAVARRELGTVPRSAARLAELSVGLEMIRALFETNLRRAQETFGTDEHQSITMFASLRNLKVGTSRGAVDVVTDALGICGIEGYLRGTPFSLDRELRDAFGGLIMVSNDRYLMSNADTLPARKRM